MIDNPDNVTKLQPKPQTKNQRHSHHCYIDLLAIYSLIDSFNLALAIVYIRYKGSDYCNRQKESYVNGLTLNKLPPL